MVFSIPVWRYPIVGDIARTVSPSSSSTRRSTPCVLGCCGPMLTVIVSVRSSGIHKPIHHRGHGEEIRGHGKKPLFRIVTSDGSDLRCSSVTSVVVLLIKQT